MISNQYAVAYHPEFVEKTHISALFNGHGHAEEHWFLLSSLRSLVPLGRPLTRFLRLVNTCRD